MLQPAESATFLVSAGARKLVAEGKLIAFTAVGPDLLELERVPFVTAPFEWCDDQFRQAATLTLDVSEAALEEGHELKDASAWNVLFNGCQPVFCDHLSFRPIQRQQWWAFGQYLRHFLFPLAVSEMTGLAGSGVFRMSRDGLHAHEASRLLGLRRFRTRLWPLFLMLPSAPQDTHPVGATGAADARLRSFHSHLYRYCRWSLPGARTDLPASGEWLGYTANRQHYSAQSQDAKVAAVAEWIGAIQPAWLVDLGANTGEFTFLAASHGAKVIAIEQDAACVGDLFRRARGDSSIFPVLSNLADLCGGCGWQGNEHSGLHSRLRGIAQMVLVLAVLHHLAISESIPLDRIADFVADITTRHAIVEIIPEDDPMVLKLSAQRERKAHEFSVAAQLTAFGRHFEILGMKEIKGSQRQLALMQRRLT
jgi:hypothetical protein